MEYYNVTRLHSAIGYVAPKDKLEGREKVIFRERDRKLAEAREMRRSRRLNAEMSNDKVNNTVTVVLAMARSLFALANQSAAEPGVLLC